MKNVFEQSFLSNQMNLESMMTIFLKKHIQIFKEKKYLN